VGKDEMMRARPATRRVGLLVGMAAALLGVTAAHPVAHSWTQVQPRPPRCDPVSDRDHLAADVRIDTGQYTLTVVATGGPSDGASVRASLWLESATAAHDSEVASGQRNPLRDTVRVPLYGATDVDFAGVSAPVSTGAAGEAVPGSHSFDPHRPGVIVWHRVDTTRAEATWRLFIGTTDNDRRACDRGDACADPPTAGPGVALDVHKIDASGFAGEWRPITAGAAHGYFCAAPVRYFSPYKTRSLARPPRPH
jgi:hypothetical protein